jgi:lipoyl(octanoyl) transferase
METNNITPRELEFKYLGRIDFLSGYKIQREILTAKINNPYSPDFILGLVHEPCFTVGRGGDTSEVINPVYPVYKTDRGGRITYHGPGQLVIYIIMDIKRFGIRGYLDFLEQKLVELLVNLGIDKNSLRPNFKGRGVWMGDKKICFIGVGIKKWVSYHGVSINLDERVREGFDSIIPCGLKSEEISSLEKLYSCFSARYVFNKFKELFNETSYSS